MKIIIFSSIIVILGLTGCLAVGRKAIPEGEIVYQGEEICTYPCYRLGFVDSNGENIDSLELSRPFSKPVWSIDGNYLYGLSTPGGVYIGSPAYWDLQKGSFRKCSQQLPYFDLIQGSENQDNPYEVIVQDISKVILLDLSKCEKLRTLVDYSFKNINMNGFSYSKSKQELFLGVVNDPQGDRSYKLIRLDLNTGSEKQLAKGINPALSPDENFLAYVGLDGLYVLDLTQDNATPLKLVGQPFFDPWEGGSPYTFTSTPSWSPDGRWIIYDRCGYTNRICDWEDSEIYKISADGGQEESIVKGGKYPNWRP